MHGCVLTHVNGHSRDPNPSSEKIDSEPASNQIPLDQIVQGDCIELLNRLPAEWVDLCFADPPFNIGFEYHNYDDLRDVDEYLDWSERWLRAVHRALKPTGSFYLAIGDDFAADLCVIARRKLGFHLRNWIIWHYTFGQQTKLKFARSHTHIFYFTKSRAGSDGPGKHVVFNADAVRVASARQTTYSDRRANPKGKLPDDVWYLRPQDATTKLTVNIKGEPIEPLEYFDSRGDTWYASRVCGTFKERTGWHGCQMPIAVLDRIVRVSSNPGQIILDPFSGSGTTAQSAKANGRRYVGIDQSEKYVEFARQRIGNASSNGHDLFAPQA
jgi:site-specific DNA-methyltransferase (adenine-specific)